MKHFFPLLASLSLFAETGGQITVDRVEWRSIELDRVHLAVHLRAFAKDAATLRDVRMERMSIGGVPFYAAPPKVPVVLKANDWTTLEPVPVTIYFRDLEALAALRGLLDKQTASIRGAVRFSLDLPLLARIFLFSERAAVAVPVRAEVPFEVPALARSATMIALSSAEKVLNRIDASLLKPNRAIVPIETTYVVEWRDGRRDSRTFRSLGVVIANGRLLTTDEAVEPWLYDPETAAGVVSGGAMFVSFETKIAGQIVKVLQKDSEMERVFVPLGNGKEVRVNLARRDTPRNAAIIEYYSGADAVNVSRRLAETVSLYRLTSSRPQSIDLKASYAGGRIVLDDPLANATGSPAFVDGYAVGLMQDEWSAIKIAQIPLAAPLL